MRKRLKSIEVSQTFKIPLDHNHTASTTFEAKISTGHDLFSIHDQIKRFDQSSTFIKFGLALMPYVAKQK